VIADPHPDSLVFLDGAFVRLGEARVSVLDRGFLFGDGVYEVVPVYGGKPFRLGEHVTRLLRSLAAIRIDTGRTHDDWQALLLDVLHRNALRDCTLYLQVTRGAAQREHRFPANITPTVFCMVSPRSAPTHAAREQGLRAVSMPDVRWLLCQIKSISLLGNVLAKQYAVDHGVDEVVQFRDGQLTEGSSCNLWVVRGGQLAAPVRDHQILEGIRYGFLVELAQQANIPFQERVISRAEVRQADEILLSSATTEVLPIVQLDGLPVGTGAPGSVYRTLRAAYDRALESAQQ